jgi:hypothetical protein
VVTNAVPTNAGSLPVDSLPSLSSNINNVVFGDNTAMVTVNTTGGGTRAIAVPANDENVRELSQISDRSFFFRDRVGMADVDGDGTARIDEEVTVAEVIYIENPSNNAANTALARILYVVLIDDDGQEDVFTEVSGTRTETGELAIVRTAQGSGEVMYGGFYISTLSAEVELSSVSASDLDRLAVVGSGTVDRDNSIYRENVLQAGLPIETTATVNFVSRTVDLDGRYDGAFRLTLEGRATINTDSGDIDGTFNRIELITNGRRINTIDSSDINGAFFGSGTEVLAGNAVWAISTTNISRNDVVSLIENEIPPSDIPSSTRRLRVRGSGAFFLER